jgi:hypothetical protein
MMKITEKEFNVLTGEETITEREETAIEKKAREKAQKDLLAEKAEAEIKAAAKQALLNRLGITAEEAALLLS